MSTESLPNREDYWSSPQSVAEYTREPFLFRGERSAFAALGPAGLAGRRVLEVGCGGGRASHFLHRAGAILTAIDISPTLIAAARARAPLIDFREGNVLDLDFEDQTFDLVVFAFNGLDAIYPDRARRRALSEIARVLRPGGRFIFSSHNLAALLFGWDRLMRPAKLWYRAKRILDRSVLRAACYLPELGIPAMLTHFAWPKAIIAELGAFGFQLDALYPNGWLLEKCWRLLGTDILTHVAEAWPYYVATLVGASAAT